ncbi:MAG: hypothetical protein QN229_06700 [Desulfurococcaceae archaeon TW002]
MAEEKRKRIPEGRDFITYEDSSKYLIQDPLVEVREYPDHVRILAEVSDQDPRSIVIRPIDALKIELFFRYKGRNIKKIILLSSPVNLSKHEVTVRNGVARISLPKSISEA